MEKVIMADNGRLVVPASLRQQPGMPKGGKMIDKGMPSAVAAETLAPRALEEIPFDPAHARASADLRDATRRSGLSLGDRNCLALGLSRKVPVLASDWKWLDVCDAVGVEIIVTRPVIGPRPH
jgi:PIN domain nuclease of toxin-antitoxin system